jgi:membrane associated rhomboid family serine protease
MFLIPIRTEKESIKIPYVTMGLIVANLLIWAYTQRIVIQQQKDLEVVNASMLEIEKDYINELFKEGNGKIRIRTFDELHQGFYNDVVKSSSNVRYTDWMGLWEEYKAQSEAGFFRQWGFIPKQFSLLKLILAMFLHAGFAHVAGNMLFLWIVGCHLEEDWGGLAFLLIYVFSGITAGSIHALKYSDSVIPLVGASGAIAGIMGIFLVRYFKTKIKFFYIWLLRIYRPWGTFSAYAYIVFPFWLVLQFFGAHWAEASGTAYWAHIGGFLFGAAAAGSLRLVGMGQVEWSGSAEADPARSALRVKPGVSLVAQAKQAVQDQPDNLQVLLFYARAFNARRQAANAGLLYNRITALILKSLDSNLIMSLHSELERTGQVEALTERNLFLLAAALEKARYFSEAVQSYILYANRFPRGRVREKALRRAVLVFRDGLKNPTQTGNALAVLRREYPDSDFFIPPQKPTAQATTQTVAAADQPSMIETALFELS